VSAKTEGRRKFRPKAESGAGGFLDRGSEPPPRQIRGLRKRCELPSGVRDGAPSAQSFFPTIFSTQDGLS